MIEETGIVQSVNEDYVTVVTQRQSTCGSCSVQKGCGTGLLGKWINRKAGSVSVMPSIPVKPGDEVVIGVAEHAMLAGSVSVYLIPLIIMLLGTGLADTFAQTTPHYGEGFVISVALISFIAAMGWIKWFSARVKSDKRYQPVLVRRIIPIEPK